MAKNSHGPVGKTITSLDVVHITWQGLYSKQHAIGILLRELPDALVLTLNYNVHEGHSWPTIHIPHRAVLDMRVLCSIPMTT